jgi:carbamoyltransferase
MGVHDNHNASVCVVEDGKLVFALQEERLNRIKNYAGFPYLSIKSALEFGKLQIDDIDLFAFPFQHNPIIHRTQAEWIEWFKSFESPTTPLIEAFRQSPGFRFYKTYNKHRRMKNIKKAGIPPGKVRFVNHHLAHAAAAYYGSPYDRKVDDVLVLTLDGGGDGLCATVYVGRHGRLEKLSETNEGHSIANIYASITFLLGMTPIEHEYKVMGLAPYSKSEYFTSAYEKLNDLIQVDGLSFRRTRGPPTVYMYPMLKELLRYERFDNIAGALQRVTEEKMVAWVKNAIAKTGIRNLAVAGGAFMNVKANQKLTELDECDHLFIFPSSGDESGSIGAAFEAYAESQLETGQEPDIQPIGPIYLGPSYDENQLDEAIRTFSQKYSIRAEKYADIDATIAEMLEKNQVVARFDGRLEFGARALGNRSILAKASDLSNVKKINNMIKMRDFWMPFAPTVLTEHETDFLSNPKKIPAPYMVLSFNTTERWRDIQAAIHSADLTARPQVLSKDYNANYWTILNRYFDSTGVGAILNTSFNLHGEPVVGSPEDAVSTFCRSGLEYLALGDRLLRKA